MKVKTCERCRGWGYIILPGTWFKEINCPVCGGDGLSRPKTERPAPPKGIGNRKAKD